MLFNVHSFQFSREKFMQELVSYSVEVMDFSTFGNLTDLTMYLEKAQALNSKLELALEKVHQDFIVQKCHFIYPYLCMSLYSWPNHDKSCIIS